MDNLSPNLPSPEALDSFWMPFTPNRQFKAQPRLLVSAKDMHYQSHDGRQILDMTAGIWCSNAGHNRPKIVEAIQKQAAEMDFAPTFNMAHPKVFEFTHKLSKLLPYDLKRVFLTNSGSESADTALKIALAYQRVRGMASKVRLIGRERAYHGVGFGGISVGGIPKNRLFGPLLNGVDHLPHTYQPEYGRFIKGEPEHGLDSAEALERIITLHDASTIAAVIVEPVAGSTGVLVPPKGYLKRLREICDKHDILLIFDEVITGFGRLGAAFGADYFGVRPDIMCMAKGITNAAVPMGAVAVSNRIYDTFMQTSETPIELFHGYTYTGHPLACAAGIATLETYAEEGLFARAADMAPYWQDAIHSLKDARHVIDIRNLGLIGGIELEPRAGAATARAMEVFNKAFDAGLLIRVTGDIIAMSPPLILEKSHIDQAVEILRKVLSETE
ncbi:aspartate aminotransferase family protein [Asticcacaulis endophyticus]|uniref:Aspartate aminotransferase family protein n=1 Tax=Asticcacaulis endophyticus TaxID=1395890 RepID=A0A918PRV0_9CAUL|nr:aspartate aminotransferase family protein [Asticcacaulis endophyticus]GGZ19771.1 aspartate aminotransferase family protein [Asticcacaulis endophyticus]